MAKFDLPPEAIDSVINSQPGAYNDDAAGDEIEAAMFRVVGEDLMDTHIDRSENAGAAMIEEFNKLSNEQRAAANRGAAYVIEERLKDKDRERAKAMLRWLISLGSA